MADVPEIFEWFLIGGMLIFLMINYNLNLAGIYYNMVVFLIIGYYIAIDSHVFKWLPISDRSHNKLISFLIGTGIAIGFTYFYNYILTGTTSLQQVFAATAFGESVFIGKLVFGVLIPIIETVFFFRIALQWLLKRLGWGTTVNPLSVRGQIVMAGISAIFTLFHATAKGVSNNPDLIATFIFAYISLWMVLTFKRILEAIVFHIVVNSQSVGITETLFANATIMYVAIGAVVLYMVITKKYKAFV